jgi:hypothetical protein
VDQFADNGASAVSCSEVVARHDLDLIRSKELAFGPGIVGSVGTVVDRNLNVGIDLDDSVIGFVDDLW